MLFSDPAYFYWLLNRNSRVNVGNCAKCKILFVFAAEAYTLLNNKSRSQFHQCFTSTFFIQNFYAKISDPKHSFVIFGAKIVYEKLSHKTLMKLTPEGVLSD
jgi:hypothetical protein